MKHLSKLLALLLVLAVTLTCTSIALGDDLPVITMLISCDSAIPAEDAPVPMEIARQAGVELHVNFVAQADHESKLNAYIASGELPDIFRASDSLVTELVSYGAILDLRPLLEQYGEHILADGEAKYSFGVNKNGSIYALPGRMSYPWAMAVRRDWMRNLGYEVGDESVIEMDIEAFKQLMVDFAQKDPDQDGVDDTFGITAEDGSIGMFTPIFAAYGIPAQSWASMYYDEEAGQCYSILQHPRFVEAMETFRYLYQNGGMDREFAAVSDASTEFSFLWNSTAGAAAWSPAGMTNNWVPRYTEEGVDENSFVYVNITDVDGTGGGYYIGYTGWLCVSAAAKYPEACVKLIDFLYTKEGGTLAYLGIEGVHYQWIDKENEKFEYIGKAKEDITNQRTDGGWIIWQQIQGDDNFELRTLTQITVDVINFAKAHQFTNLAIIRNSLPEINKEIGSNRTDIIMRAFANMVVAEGDLEPLYESFLAEYEAIGGNIYNEQFTEIYKAETGI